MTSHPQQEPTRPVVGIDFGGTTIKGALVNTSTGLLESEWIHVETPEPARPDLVAEAIKHVVGCLPEVTGTIGVAVPGIVRRGVLCSAANIDTSWIGVNAAHRFGHELGRPVEVLNDADAAGVAEAHHGAARARPSTNNDARLVLVTTLGTGIGSALIYDGVLIPNSELGHLELDGCIAETMAATSARERDQLSYPEWATRLTRYFRHLERLFTPDLIVVGGAVSQSWDQFGHLIGVDTDMVPAALGYRAGVVGAALAAGRSN
jgi:polyphosphate glucokinase